MTICIDVIEMLCNVGKTKNEFGKSAEIELKNSESSFLNDAIDLRKGDRARTEAMHSSIVNLIDYGVNGVD